MEYFKVGQTLTPKATFKQTPPSSATKTLPDLSAKPGKIPVQRRTSVTVETNPVSYTPSNISRAPNRQFKVIRN